MVQAVELVDGRVEQCQITDKSHEGADGDFTFLHQADPIHEDDHGPQRADKHHGRRVNGPKPHDAQRPFAKILTAFLEPFQFVPLLVKGDSFADAGDGILQNAVEFCRPFPHYMVKALGAEGEFPASINEERDGYQSRQRQLPVHVK